MFVHTTVSGNALDITLPAWNDELYFDLDAMNSFITSTSSTDSTLMGTESQPLRSPDSTTIKPLGFKHSQDALRTLRAQFQAFCVVDGVRIIPPLIQTPEPLLHSAARRNNRQIIQLLVEAGADINARDGAGRTPLLAAAESGLAEAALLLLELGADINAHDDSGRTVLSLAVANCCEKGVEFFLRHGADPMLGSTDLLRSTHSGFTNGRKVIEQ
ncbi:ankyrin repeat-containing domain protein [Plectosphaerella plurivora]|uniref:Ankyrin repeat-containing domain protein n=1 Tax=Plectosphaerella plurivora TaxID=936078 RepID=A0A9P8VHD9_9PEZI|nr:ankyrin repeat-containing domain protein [Plectosphaerella plurivora]